MTGNGEPIDLEKALVDPAAVFGTPEDVLDCAGLTREQKIEVLRRWEQDALALEELEEGQGEIELSADLLDDPDYAHLPREQKIEILRRLDVGAGPPEGLDEDGTASRVSSDLLDRIYANLRSLDEAPELEHSLLYQNTGFGRGRLANVFYGLSTFVAFVSLMAFVRSEQMFSYAWNMAVGFSFVVIAVGGGLGRWFEQSYKRWHQKLRDGRARTIFRQAKQGTAGDYSLYIRAFETTGQMAYDDGSGLPFFGVDARPDQTVDLEAALAEVVEAEIPMVALGEPGEHFGVGRIKTTDQQWQDDLRVLAEKALVLFAIPSDRPGTLWELDFIREQGFLRKTVFIMPPKAQRKAMPWAEKWQQITSGVKHLQLPPYEKHGLVFALKDDGSLRVSSSLGGTIVPQRLDAVVGEILTGMATTHPASQ